MSSSHVTIDAHRILRLKSQPFFPIAARHIPIGATPALLYQIGFNALRWTPFGVDAQRQQSWEVPKDLGGLTFYAYIYNRGDLSCDREQRQRELSHLVDAIKDHPSLLCYEQRNEPAYSHKNHATAQSPPEGLIAGSEVIRSLDPDHPIRVGHMSCNLVSTLRKYNPAVDIVGCNPYVVIAPGMRSFVGLRPDGKFADCPDQTLSSVGQYTRKMMRVAEGRPVWMQIQGSANENWYQPLHTPEIAEQGSYEHDRLYPSYWQMRFMAFNSIVRGATGLEWMLINHPVDSPSWLEVQKLIGELRSLHDALASPPWQGQLDVEYRELGFSDWDGVETLVKINRAKVWIFACNTQFDPMIATFSGLLPEWGTQLAVVGGDSSINIHNGRFTDRFQPYEVRIYTTQNEGSCRSNLSESEGAP